MYVRNTPYKVLSNSDVRIRINDNNLSKLQRYQAQRQDTQGQKVSVNSIVNECIHNYLSTKV